MGARGQRSFSGGELSPSLYQRTDQEKYQAGLRTMRNFYVLKSGGAESRPGTTFVGEISDSSSTVRLIPFFFSTSQTHMLEFGATYMRVITSGAQVTETAQNITAATQADPCVVTISSHGYSNGDEVFISGVGGMTELNGRNFKVANVTANTFELQEMDGTDLDSTGYTAYTSGGTAAKIYEITTPYAAADLPELQFVQSADVITIVHPDYAPRELSRTSASSWSLALKSFGPTQTWPTGLSVSNSGTGLTVKYQVCAINRQTGEISLPGTGTAQNITGITAAEPPVVTIASHGLNDGDEVYITGISGMTELNGRRFVLANTATNTFELQDHEGNDIDASGYTAYSSGGTAAPTHVEVDGSESADSVVSWTAANGAEEYVVYRSLRGSQFGAVGVATRQGSFTDESTGLVADFTDTPPKYVELFLETSDFPSCVNYVQGRLALSNTINNPEKNWLSRSGDYGNFSQRYPLQDDDSLAFVLSGKQVNAIRHIMDVDRPVYLTQGAERSLKGNEAGIVLPAAINPDKHSENGASILSPIEVNGTILYVQERGSVVRDLDVDSETAKYGGKDLTVYSFHLFEGYTIDDWTYGKTPNSIIWAVRSDGTLLGFTYLKEHEIWAWHRHDFEGGVVENVASVPEGSEDAVYVVVKRTINSKVVRYIERFATRFVDSTAVEDLQLMDSVLSYDGTNSAATTMTLSGGSSWDEKEQLTLTASVSYFASTDVGAQIHLTGSDGSIVRVEIEAYTSGTVVTVRATTDVPSVLQATATATWGKAVKTVTGLWHLEGETVSGFGDAFVAASPNNANYTTVTVSNGQATFDKWYQVLHVGLPFTCDMELLDIDTVEGEAITGDQKLVSQVVMQVKNTRGPFVGGKPPSDDTTDPLEGLTELKLRNSEDYDSPVSLATKDIDVVIQSEWNSDGRVFMRLFDPLPATILSVVPKGIYPLEEEASF